MPIIFVSSLPFGGGERLARELARKLGYAFLSREDVVAKANESGIPVGKLEVAMVKRPAVQDRLARLRDRYLAVATSVIAERAAKENIVYYGRAGHLLLPGVAHVLRVRVLPEPGQRLETAMERLRLSREKALTFLKEVDGDIASWVRFVHGVSVDDLGIYDVVLNLDHISIENAAAALCGIAELPDFRPTPASLRAMEDRLLQARARIRLALDERTAEADLTVRANDGALTITYVPRQARVAPSIPEVLAGLPGCREIRYTMAGTTILWVEEHFAPGSDNFQKVNEVARRWGAAVELLRFRPEGEEAAPFESKPAAVSATFRPETGGVEEDVPEPHVEEEERSFRDTLAALVTEGRSGGGQTVSGSTERLVSALNPGATYSLLVVGDLFLSKPAAVRGRLGRELGRELSRRLKVPAVSSAELAARLHFGFSGAVKVAAALAGLAFLYAAVFTHQDSLLSILGGEGHKANPWTAIGLVAVLSPVVSALFGLVATAAMKVLKLE